jgi:general secretion pathway protein G
MKAQRMRRSYQRGVTLIEVMIVVVILGLIAGGVAVAVFPKLNKAKIDTTTTSARAMRSVAETWRSEHASDQCPTPQILLSDHAIDSASKITDAWDDQFTITCQDDETIVSSPGPDKKENTADDIRVPALQQQQQK